MTDEDSLHEDVVLQVDALLLERDVCLGFALSGLSW